jgi:deoxyadenosine kinase
MRVTLRMLICIGWCARAQPLRVTPFMSTAGQPQAATAWLQPRNPQESLSRVYISIAGLIGAGKSSLATALGEELGMPVYYEPVADNEYLDDFYADMARYGFALQVHLLNKRFRQQQEIVWSEKGAVQDRTIYEDAVFARMLADDGLMERRDYETYLGLFSTMAHFMQRPDVIVYLDVSPEESLRRIRLRRRECEGGITLEYLTKLAAAYDDFIADVSRSIHVIRVEYSEFHSAAEMAAEIARQYESISHISDVRWTTSTTVSAAGEAGE